jgi:polyhydroxyalkanoate synthesis regulator phasin
MARTPDPQPAGRRVPPSPAEIPATRAAGTPPPVGVAATADPRVAPPVEVDPLWFTRIDDAVRSLRAAVVLAIVLALVAAGIAVWALVKANRANDRTASAQRVSALDSRLAALEQRVNGLSPATTADVSSLRQQLSRTQASVAKLSANSTTTTTSVSQLSQRVDRLSQQVAQLQAKQGSNSTTTTTNGTSTTP